MSLPYPPPFMDLATLAQHICCGESSIEKWVKEGTFPPPHNQGGKRLWRWKDVEKHLADPERSGAPSAERKQAEDITNATRRAVSAH